MLCTTGSGTPALAARETKVCRREWKVASGVRVRRPSIFTLVSICAALKISSSPRLIRHLLFLYQSASVGLTKAEAENALLVSFRVSRRRAFVSGLCGKPEAS